MIKLTKASRRNTQCHWVKIAGLRILFSYETAMAFQLSGYGSARRENTWSKTTRKHLWETGAIHYRVVPDIDFEMQLQDALFQCVLDELPREVISRAIGKRVMTKLLGEPA